MDVRVYVWDNRPFNGRYKIVYAGPPEDIPDEYREWVALIDASDYAAVNGVGSGVPGIYGEYYMYHLTMGL